MRRELPINAIALAVSAVCCAFLAGALALVPASASRTVWKGYRVLAVPVELDESDIASRLSEAGIREFATSSNSAIVNDSRMVPSQPFLDEKNAELDVWFVDAERGVRFFYLKDIPFLDDRVERAFSPQSFSWRLEGAARPSAAGVALFAAFLALLAVFSSSRRSFLSAALPFALFAAKCPDAATFGSAVTAAYGIFLLCELLKVVKTGLPRGYWVARLRQRPVAALPLAVAASIAAFTRPLSRASFALALALSASLSVCSELAFAGLSARRERRRLHPTFRPECMHPDTIARGKIGKRAALLSVSVPVLIGVSFFLFGAVASPSDPGSVRGGTDLSSDERLRVLYIPSPSGYTSRSGFDAESYSSAVDSRGSAGIPDLAWFVAVRWNLETAPWRRLDEEIRDPEPGTVVKMTEYESDGNAKITAEEKNRGTFDSAFIKKAVSGPITPIEKLLVEQGRFVTVSPTRHGR